MEWLAGIRWAVRRKGELARQTPRGAMRRRLLLVVTGMCLMALSGCSLDIFGPPAPTAAPPTPTPVTCAGASESSNPVRVENPCLGTASWRQNKALGPTNAIAGYVAPASAKPGDTVKLYVTTTAPTFTYAIYRMGYYHDEGGRLMYQSGEITGIQQPAPTVSADIRTVECPWQNPVTIKTLSTWVSGVYVIKLVSSQRYMRYAFFVLRSAGQASAQASVLFVLPFLTYQAYDLWGGYSLYRGTAPDGSLQQPLRSYAVSFDRPYATGGGLANFGVYDLPLLSWMESQDYNISYAADFDLNGPTMPLNQYKLIVISGHSEYWSTGMRDAVTKARDAGTSLAFFGGNDVYWHVRLASDPLGLNQLVICYKDAKLDPLTATKPDETTVRWRDAPLNQPEQALMGEAYGGGLPLTAIAPMTLAEGSSLYLTGTSFTTSSVIPGIVGGEYDQTYPTGGPANVQIIASSMVHCAASSLCPTDGVDTAEATMYTAPSGAHVFDAGTFQWAWGLSRIIGSDTIQGESSAATITPGAYVNAGFKRLTINILRRLLS